MKKFKMSDGCPRSKECIVCEDDGIKCGTKGVVYLASCMTCDPNTNISLQELLTGGGLSYAHEFEEDNLSIHEEGTKKYQYVGETSRPLRERVLEHQKNFLNWKKDSFWLEHWFQEHGMDTVRPQFKFEVLTSYKDALRRQLAEGLYILERGDLNK